MPNKRNRKDSEISTEDETTNVPDGACSSISSGSVTDENELACQRICCMPDGCLMESMVNLLQPCTVAKVICNSDSCTAGTYMHNECFAKWEEGLLTHLKSHGRARSWSEKQRRQNLWTKRGYDLAYKACGCKCTKGHLRKDLDWNPQAISNHQDDVDGGDVVAGTKKKNRKKHKDLPSLGSKGTKLIVKSKSKPIPTFDNRTRHSSASSSVSIDQGYSSSSPATSDNGMSFMFSPPHTRSGGSTLSRYLYEHITSPLPEVPDDNQFESIPEVPMQHFRRGFSPPVLPDEEQLHFPDSVPQNAGGHVMNEQFENGQYNGVVEEIRHLMRTIDLANNNVPTHHRGRNRTQSESALMDPNYMQLDPRMNMLHQQSLDMHQWLPNQHDFALQQQQMQVERMKHEQEIQQSEFQSLPPNDFPHEFLNQLKRQSASLTQYPDNRPQTTDTFVKILSEDEDHERVIKVPNEQCDSSGRHTLTEIRIVPMKTTTFTQRRDFTAFQSVLPKHHINPYHIKMEGEGYGSDDLRNFILSKLSVAKCSQMCCAMCMQELAVYDHFPLIDGVMFLSPEANPNGFKDISLNIDGKMSFVHGVCVRCMEGVHNIVCRMCKSRWDGSYHQLGSLYMFDIFAAYPCCSQRLACKNCGNAILNGGLKHFSDYSNKISCPRCHVNDYHFVKAMTSYHLEGLVFS